MTPAQDIARGIVEGYVDSADAFPLLVAEIAKAIEACAIKADAYSSAAGDAIRAGGEA